MSLGATGTPSTAQEWVTWKRLPCSEKAISVLRSNSQEFHERPQASGDHLVKLPVGHIGQPAGDVGQDALECRTLRGILLVNFDAAR